MTPLLLMIVQILLALENFNDELMIGFTLGAIDDIEPAFPCPQEANMVDSL